MSYKNTFIYPESDIYTLDWSNPDEVLIERDSVGRPLFAQPVDQFDSQPFVMGENGFRRSDIAILQSAESEDLKKAIASRIVEIQASYPDQNLSDADLASMAIPRYCQSSSSLRDWAASLENSGISKVADTYIKAAQKPKVEQPTIKFDDSNPQVD